MSDAPDFTPVQRGAPDTAIPRFFTEAFKNEAESAKRGQPVFAEREMVHIIVPGDKSTEVTRIVTEDIRRRFARQYAAWQANREQALDGTPIEQLPGITAARVEELKFSKVRTIEALASLPDNLLERSVSMGGFALRDTAKNWLEQAAGNAPMEKLRAENEAKDARIGELERQVQELAGRIDAMNAQRLGGRDPQP